MIVYGRTTHAPILPLLAAAMVLLANPPGAPGQKLQMPGDPVMVSPSDASGHNPSYSTSGAAPFTTNGSILGEEPWTSASNGVVYSPTLGAHIRARFNTRSYGQEQGFLNLGTMRHWDMHGGVAFFDGQVNINEESHAGYNVGLGYRWKTLPLFSFSPDDEKIMGISFWSDGQHSGGQNFFPQVGAGLEFLGDRIDFRANGYAPVGSRQENRDVIVGATPTFTGNNISVATTGITDIALTVGEAELAARIADLEAWAFTGVYGMSGGGIEEVGGKIGLRGYATPDLALSIALTNDDEFDTRAVFNLTWFIGRTRAENCPCGTLDDRFREPVIRNDYVALAQREFNGTGTIATDTADDEAIRIVHVDGNAAAGGDGTFENPYNSLDSVAGTLEGDIILAHADSTIGGTISLLNDQTFFGEGGGAVFALSTNEFGSISLPETETGSSSGVVPILTGGGVSTVTVALNNTVRNLTFDGGTSAVVSALTGSNNANLSDLTISDMTSDAIALTTVSTEMDTTDIDGDSNTTETIALLGNVVIDNVTFDSVVGSDILIDATESINADENQGETVAISNITTTRDANANTSASIVLENTGGTTGDTVTISNYTFDGTNGGAFAFDTIQSQVNVTNSSITGGDVTGLGGMINITNTEGLSSGNSISFADTVTLTDVTGTAVNIVNNEIAVAFEGDITTGSTFSGGGVIVDGNQAMVNLGGPTPGSGGIQANNDTAVQILNSQFAVNVSANVDSNGTGNAVEIIDASDPTTDNSTAGVTISGNITNESGMALLIDDGDDDITILGTIMDDGASGASSGVLIQNRHADSQVIASGAITVDSDSTGGVRLIGNDATSRVDLGQLDITSEGVGFSANGGEVNMLSTNNTISTTDAEAINVSNTTTTNANGFTFDSVDVGGSATNAVTVQDFDGTVTINDGELTTLGEAVTITDASLVLSGVDIDAGGSTAINFMSTDATARTLSVLTMDANSGAILVNSSGGGGVTATLSDITEGAAFDFDVSGAGNLTASMTNVEGTGATTLDVAGTGNGSLTMNTVNTGSTIAANSTGGSSGNLTVTAINSGNTTAFTGVTVNDQGNGDATASFTNVTSTSGVDFDSAGAGSASLSVSGGSYGGDIDVNATNSDNLTANVTGNTTLTAGDVIIAAGNTGTFNSTITGVNAQAGGLTISTANSVTNATTTITNGTYNDAVDLDFDNNGTLTFTMTGATITTGADVTGLSMTLNPGFTSGNVTVSNNSVTTNDGVAYEFDYNGGAINYLLDNNTFINNSATLTTAVLDLAGSSTLNATVRNNTFTNSNVAAPLQFSIETTSGSPTVNYNMSANTANSGGGSGNGTFEITETSGTFGIFERDTTLNNVGNRNNGTVTFPSNVIGDFTDLVSPPATP